MSASLLLPALAVVLVSLSAGIVQRRLSPPAAARVLVALAVIAVSAVAGALALVAFGYVAQFRWVADWAGWCRSIYGTHRIPAWQGLGSLGALALMGRALARARRRALAVRASYHGATPPLEVVHTDEPIAYASPGRGGGVVVSSGMLRALDADERRVLLAHERAHLQRRHYRFLETLDLAVAALPILRPLRAQLRFATERWADEDAAREVGDRRLVARAIVRAAVAQADWRPRLSMAIAGLGVPARVDALLQERVAPPLVGEAAATAGGAALMVSVSSSALQFHHLLAFAAHICRV